MFYLSDLFLPYMYVYSTIYTTTTILDTIFLYWLFYSTGALGLYLTKLILKATHTGGSAFVSIDKRNCQSTLKKKDFQQGHGGIVVVRPCLRSAFSTCGIQKAGPSARSTYSESKQTAA